jgi:transposase
MTLEAAMMGRRGGDQASLFYEFRLDDRVPKDHLLRRIDGFVTAALADIHEQLEPYYSAIGRPSVDPELMIRMLIIGYCYGLRSERRLTQEVELHLAYRWFCRLDLDDKVPHHSTFSENRLHRFRESDVFRHIFERVVATCMASGLIKGEGFAVDASVMEANASRYHGKAPDEIVWAQPERQTRAVREYLAALEAEPEPNPDRKPPKVISPSDPCSAWTAKANKRVQFGYGLNYLIDIENAVIVDVEPTPARTYDEVEATKTMLDRTERRLHLKPKRLAANTAYGTGRFLGWLVGRKIAPHIPVRDAAERDDGIFSRSDFRWDSRQRVYVCPNNKVLHTTGTVYDGTLLRYRASKFDCDVCPLKMKCCPNTPARHVPRDLQENARDVARRLMRTKAFLKSRDERKRVEMRFAHLKIHHGFERMRLRGLSGARDEFHLAAIVQNLKTLALRVLPPPQFAGAV